MNYAVKNLLSLTRNGN